MVVGVILQTFKIGYCVKYSYNVQMKKYVLIFLFFFIIFLAYYMVKLIFRFELFTQFMQD